MYIAPHLWKFFEGPRTRKKKVGLRIFFCKFLSNEKKQKSNRTSVLAAAFAVGSHALDTGR